MALWLVATPIGTLGDLSPRAREVLSSVSLIAAEDTRTTRKLLSALGLPAPELLALHAHNEGRRVDQVLERARSEDVALVSDAGTPAVSDPGRELVAAAHAAGVRVVSAPGPSALVSALALSGFPAAPATFLGFVPRKKRDRWCDDVLARGETLVAFEAPSRVADVVGRLAERAPAREAALCREISKAFEEVVRAPLAQLAAELRDREVRGECVLVLGPGEPRLPEAPEVRDGAKLGDIASALAARWGRPRREVYQALMALERGD